MMSWCSEELKQGVARAGKTTRRRAERRPCLELLEDRACPSLTLSLPVLTATVGTSFSQQVQVTGNDTSDSYEFSSVEAPGDPLRPRLQAGSDRPGSPSLKAARQTGRGHEPLSDASSPEIQGPTQELVADRQMGCRGHSPPVSSPARSPAWPSTLDCRAGHQGGELPRYRWSRS
jgi:hypothetical protein